MEAAEKMEFEKAAALRDKIMAIQSVAQKQKMANMSLQEADVIAFVRAFSQCLVQVFFIRDGQMTGRENFNLSAPEEQSRSEVMTAFVEQFYSGTAHIPKEIILQEPLMPEEAPLLEAYLAERRGSKVTITVPIKGEKQKLVELAYKNANIVFEQFGEKMKREEQRTKGAMEEIRQALGLPQMLHRVEAYDISNTQGFASVGSMVVFEDGKAKYSDYRKFKIKTVVGPNDFASMQEVITRRLNHAIREKSEGKSSSFTRLPDLILMDGGRTQVHAAEEILAAFGMEIPVCGMVKDDNHRTRGLYYNNVEIPIDRNSEAFKLITRIQDEAHRFAIEFHRQLRGKGQVHSVLDDIEGIGPARRKALMRHYLSLDAIRSATVEELAQLPSMNEKAAESVYQFFHD